MNRYVHTAVYVALLWAGAAVGQGTVMNGDSSGLARKPGGEGAVGTAGASGSRAKAPRQRVPPVGSSNPQGGHSTGDGRDGPGRPASDPALPQ